MKTNLRRGGVIVVALFALVALIATIAPAQGPTSGPIEAGGKAIAHYGDSVRAGQAKQRRTAETRAYKTGVNGLEPTMGVNKDGHLFYVGVPGLGAEIMRSNDQGETWTKVSPGLAGHNSHPVTLDPYVFVDEWTSRVFTIDLTVACSYLSFSDDEGESWTTNPLACGAPINDHQTLFSGPPVSTPMTIYDNIVYYCYNGLAYSNCTKSIDGGLTFTATGEPAFHPADVDEDTPGQRDCGGLHGHGVVGDDGTVYLPKEHCNEGWIAISRNEGQTWEHSHVTDMPVVWGPDPSVAVDDEGNIYFVFIAEKDRLPYLSVSTSGGDEWTKPQMIGYPGLTETVHATVDAGKPGEVAIAYYGTNEVEGPIEKRKYTEATWDGFMTTTSNALSKRPLFQSGQINPADDPLMKGPCGPRRCYDALDFIDVVVDGAGHAWSAFVDNCFEDACPGTPNTDTSGLVGRLSIRFN